MFSQVVRNPRHLAPCRSLLRQHPVRFASTSADSPSNSPDPTHLPTSADSTKKVKEIYPSSRRTAYLRTWEPVRNVADAWAILRVLERKYGKIITAHFLKDFENPSKYQLMSWVVFENPEALARIPKTGFTFSIPSPGIDKPPHEINMEDLEHLAVTARYEPGYEVPTPDPGSKKVIGVKITPSEFEYNGPLYANRIYQTTNFRTMEAFVGWAGFSPLNPIPPRQFKEHELFSDESDDEQVRMRAALETAARYTSAYNPGTISSAEMAKMEGAEVEVEKKGAKGRKSRKATEAEASSMRTEPMELETASTMTATATPAEPSRTPSSLASEPSVSAPIEHPPQTHSEPTPAPLTPEQLEAKRVAREQMDSALELAKQLAARTASERERRKQPKPVVKSAKPKKSKKGSASPPQGGYFYDFEAKPQKDLTVMDRLWGLFGR